MLSETKQNVLDILTKLQALESGISSLSTVHESLKEEAVKQHIDFSKKKLTLTAELHRLLS